MSRSSQVRTYKSVLSADESRQRRQLQASSVRKKRKDDELKKARGLDDEDDELAELFREFLDDNWESKIHDQLTSDDPERVGFAILFCRWAISEPDADPTRFYPFVPHVVKSLQCAELQFEAAWFLTNFAIGDSKDCHWLIQNGGATALMQCALSGDDESRVQALWALGNLTGDDDDAIARLCLDNGLLDLIVHTLRNASAQSNAGAQSVDAAACAEQKLLKTVEHCAWILNNIAKCPSFSTELELLSRCVALAKEIIVEYHAHATISDNCLKLFDCVARGDDECVQSLIVDNNLLPILIEFASRGHRRALLALGRTAGGADSQTQAVLDAGLLAALSSALSCGVTASVTRQSVLFALSNVLSGSETQIAAAIHSGLMPFVVEQVEMGEYDVRGDAIFALCHAVIGCSDDLFELVATGRLRSLVPLLDKFQGDLLHTMARAVLKIVYYAADSGSEQLLLEIEESNLFDVVEQLIYSTEDEKLLELFNEIINYNEVE